MSGSVSGGALSLAQRFRQNAQERAGSLGEYSLPLDKGIPVREVLTQIFTHRRAVTAKEFLMYFCYVAVFVAVVLQINQTEVRAPEEAAPRRRQPYLRVRVLRRYPGVAFSPPPPALPPALLPHRSASTAPTWRCTTRFWTRSSPWTTPRSRRRSPASVRMRGAARRDETAVAFANAVAENTRPRAYPSMCSALQLVLR